MAVRPRPPVAAGTNLITRSGEGTVMSSPELDAVDRGILHLLQEDARNNTAADIADAVGVTANTVRNRIDRLEERDVITGYVPEVRYEQAGYQLKVSIECSAPVPDRTDLAHRALEIDGVVAVRELMTGRGNIQITVVADESEDVTRAAAEVHEIGLEIDAEELVKNDHARPFSHFDVEEPDR
jgi:DNA-binding Lrp family transcriptional regulator